MNPKAALPKPAPAPKPPGQAGFRMPAEWEPHDSTWIAWPHNRSDWPGKLQAIPWVYADIVRHLSRVERVDILVRDQAAEVRALRILQLSGAVMDSLRFHRWPTNRVWTRDYGPAFVTNGRSLGAVKWRFNAWAKYPDWKLDDDAGKKMANHSAGETWQPEQLGRPLVLEGGSIDVNGAGTLITTEECLLSDIQGRNPGVSRETVEKAFSDYLGIRNVIWLGSGIVGDDTHGHVDDITRFVSPNTVVTTVEPDSTDPNHKPLQQNLELLRSAVTADGKPLNIVELPMPSPVIFRGQRLPASYANFYVANGLVLIPTFNDSKDRRALAILAECFPGREVVGIHSRDLVWGLGTLHCMTQQQPRIV
ncbi:MAG TPA: agmatine deiminase family protein [Terriglobales bacterium]|nr:agmatine deiminase family protein [Terriglobales bacterium]